MTVKKTTVRLSDTKITLENGESKLLKAAVSTGHPVKFKSSKSGVASIDENGVILAKKPGTATITATADKTSATCKVTVKKPSVSLNKTSVKLFRKERVHLSVTSTSKTAPKWKSNKKSVATVDSDGMVTTVKNGAATITVDDNGTVTAVKNGTAVITVTIDGVFKTCEITVKKPVITFEKESVTLNVKEKYRAKATVSSKNKPVYSSSNTSVATVDENGVIYAKAVGKAFIYAKEDGTKERLTVFVK